jgi:hypothetical protein
VDYPLKPQSLSKQRKAAYSAGARYFAALIDPGNQVVSIDLMHAMNDTGLAPQGRVRSQGSLTLAQLIDEIREAPEKWTSDLPERIRGSK